MKMLLLGAALGYVLGAKAGRGRYEQIVQLYRKVADHPAVQGAAGIARAKIGEKTGFGARGTNTSVDGWTAAPAANGRQGAGAHQAN